MKRILLMAATAGIVLSGCVKNESVSGPAASDSKIAFDAPVVGATTRVVTGEIDNSEAYSTNETFKVWGWYHTNDYTSFGDTNNGWANYMTDTDGNPLTVTYDGVSTWAPAQDYFWPKTGKLTFAAYSPAEATGTYSHTAQGLQIAGFAVPAVDAQYDLLYSDRSYNRTSASTGEDAYQGGASNTYTGVDIIFHHALSSIKFKTGTKQNYETADVFFKIKKITVSNVANTGDFNQGLTDGPGAVDSQPQWTPDGTTTSYVAFEGSFDVPEDGAAENYTEPTGTKDLILLPQSFAGNDSAVVEIEYTMGTAASGEINKHTASFQLSSATNAQTWEPNKRYTYNIIFGLDKITFAPIVENWVDVPVTPDIEL